MSMQYLSIYQSLTSFINVLQFSIYMSFPSWLNLFLVILFILMLLQMGLFLKNFSFCQFVVSVQKNNRFLCIDFVPCNFMYLFIISNIFVKSLEFSTYNVMSSADSELSGPGLFFVRTLLITNSISLLVIGLFRFSHSS